MQTFCTSPAASEVALHRLLVEAAILAPSPDNNQPWRFVSRGDALVVCLDPERALPSDVNGMFDLIGLGAAVENACLVARGLGYEPQVRYRKTDSHPSPGMDCQSIRLREWVEIHFAEGGSPDPLAEHLAARCTCRKLYSKRPPAADMLERIRSQTDRFPAVQLDWVTDRPRIRRFARLIAASDLIRFQYEPFHNELFRQLRFSPQEAEAARDGLDLRTLQLPPGAGFLLKLLRPWRRMNRLHRLGLGRLLVVPSAISVLHSGALGLLSVGPSGRAAPVGDPSRSCMDRQPLQGFPGTDRPSVLRAGRALQRVWLAATAENLALHSLGSLPIFLAHWEQLGGRRLETRHQRLVEGLAAALWKLVPAVKGRTLVMLFRLGTAAAPRHRSLRRPADEVFLASPTPDT